MNRDTDRLRPLMVLGCSSDAGKSWIATALCRWFRRQGVNVAPFKAQNLSNNARVVAASEGVGEIGVAQWLQARAAGVEPDVRMNPVLVKPEADTRSQVVVRGRADLELSRLPWEERHGALWAPMAESFDELRAEHELVVLEGAGSPAEINLRDQVNNRMLAHADAAALLIADIDRGGAFAHLFGTHALVPEGTRRRLRGFVLNRFRGDAGLLAPGPEILTERTGMAALGVVPFLRHRLPREEGALETSEVEPRTDGTVVLPRFPFGSNLDEFHRLEDVVRVRWSTSPGAFDDLRPERDLAILPGSKNVAGDLRWLEAQGLAGAVRRAAARGVGVVGVCGGAMMLGQRIADPEGVEGVADEPGLGLLELRTTLTTSKRVERARLGIGGALGRFGALEGAEVEGYEIRYGELAGAAGVVARVGERPVAWSNGAGVFATTVHGLFESTEFLERLFGAATEDPLEATLERLADVVEEHLDTALLRSWVERG